MLDLVPCSGSNDSKTLAAYQDVITAGLSSRRTTIVRDTVDFWNSTFGKADSLQYPDQLRAALQRIRSIADLDLPTFPIAGADSEQEAPQLEETDDDAKDTDDMEWRASIPKPSPSPRPILSRRKDLSNPASPSPMKQPRLLALPLKSKPRNKLRHEDSQIQFEPVHSSPAQADAAEPQHLTERQKEVAERQHEDAMLYSEINFPSSASKSHGPMLSSPKATPSKPVATSSSNLNARLRSSSDQEGEADVHPSTPPVVAAAGLMSDDMPPSSPTPASAPASASRGLLSLRRVDLYDPPSSPPGEDDEMPLTANERPGDRDGYAAAAYANSEECPLPTSTDVPMADVEPNNDLHGKDTEQPIATTNTRDEPETNEYDPTNETTDPASDNSVDPALPAAQLEAEHKSFIEQQEREERIRTSQEQHGHLQDSQPDTNAVSGPSNQAHGLSEPETTEPAHEATAELPIQGFDVAATAEDEENRREIAAQSTRGQESILDSFIGAVAPQSGTSPTLNPPNAVEQKSGANLLNHHATEPKRAGSKEQAPSPAAQSRKSPEDSDEEMYDCVVVNTSTTNSQRRRPQSTLQQGQKTRKGVMRRFSEEALGRSGRRNSQASEAGSQTSSLSRRSKKVVERSSPKSDAALSVRDDNISINGSITGRRTSLSEVSTTSSQDRTQQGIKNRASRLSRIFIPDTPGDEAPRRRGRSAGLTPRDAELDEPSPGAFKQVGIQVVDTPAPLASNKRRKVVNDNGSIVSQVSPHSSEQGAVSAVPATSDNADLSPGTSKDQQVTKSSLSNSVQKRKRDAVESKGEAHAQSASDAEGPSESRHILSPSSILLGLRKVLDDCKGMVLGKDQMREMDDVLFEIKTEMFEAARRGRASQ